MLPIVDSCLYNSSQAIRFVNFMPYSYRHPCLFHIFLLIVIFSIPSVLAADFSPKSAQQSNTLNTAKQQDDIDDKQLYKNGHVNLPIITIDSELQEISGLRIMQLKVSNFQEESVAYGEVINILPLVELRENYLIASAQLTIAETRLKQAQQALSRGKDLRRSDAIATKKLSALETELQISQAQLEASRYHAQSLREYVLLAWGKILTQWILSPVSEQFTQLLSGQLSLLRIALPPGKNLPANIKKIYVDPNGHRSLAVAADFISHAPLINPNFQGESYFFQSTNKITAGLRLTAWIPGQRQPLSGVIIPQAAVIRYLGQAYVYLQIDTEQFMRRKISRLVNAADGYFNQHDILPGDKLVITGAQMLLSQEFRAQIPDEDDD